MNNLIVKQVDFNGAALMAVQDKEADKIYVGVSFICRGIGLNKDEKDRQVKNVQSNIVLKQGCRKFDAGVFDPNNEALGLELDYLPLWLAKISITPKMQDEQPELTERLVAYQIKAKDVLASAFIKKSKESKQSKSNLSSVNNAVKIIGQYMKQANISEEIQLLTVKGLYAQANVFLPIDISADKVYYDTKQIAKHFHMITKTGKPAYHAVSQIIKQLEIFDEEIKEVWETNGSWQGVVKKYSDTVINKINKWLTENEYPSVISDGNKKYYVLYNEAI